METYETIEKDGKILKIYLDENPSDPREWDNLSKFVLSHKRYNLPNELNINFDNFEGWAEIEEYLKNEFKAVLIYTVRGYDHSGFSISLNTDYPFNDYWDSGQLGFICVLEEDIKKEYGKLTKKNIKIAEKCLKAEFETYKNYIEGDVYGFEVIKINPIKKRIITEYQDGKKDIKDFETTEEEVLDSCWGYYGEEGIKQIKEENNF